MNRKDFSGDNFKATVEGKEFNVVPSQEDFTTGRNLIKRNPEVANLARQDAINTVCQGENDTDFHRALANVFIDYQEGKISKERYDELIKPFTTGL